MPADRASLGRLGIDKMALYQIHWPGFITNGPFNDAFVRGLADCANSGLTSAVGVSNFKPERIRKASKILQARRPCRRKACGPRSRMWMHAWQFLRFIFSGGVLNRFAPGDRRMVS